MKGTEEKRGTICVCDLHTHSTASDGQSTTTQTAWKRPCRQGRRWGFRSSGAWNSAQRTIGIFISWGTGFLRARLLWRR